MTALIDGPIATVTQLRPSHRSPANDLHAQLLAESNRLLNAADETELDAQDALSELIGGLINLASQPRALSKQGLVDLLRRKADFLGCPPAAVAATTGRRGRR